MAPCRKASPFSERSTSFCCRDSSSSCLIRVLTASIAFSYFSFASRFSFSTRVRYWSSASSMSLFYFAIWSACCWIFFWSSALRSISLKSFTESMIIWVIVVVAFENGSSTLLFKSISWRRRCCISFMMAAESERCIIDFETDEPTIESLLSDWFLNAFLNAASSPTDECTENRGVWIYLSICPYTSIVFASHLLIHSFWSTSSSALKSGALTYRSWATMQYSNWSASDARWTASSRFLPKIAICWFIFVINLVCLLFSTVCSRFNCLEPVNGGDSLLSELC